MTTRILLRTGFAAACALAATAASAQSDISLLPIGPSSSPATSIAVPNGPDATLPGGGLPTASAAVAAMSPNAPIGVQVTARTTAVISAPMSGQLIEFAANDGDAIQEGQVIARFNCAQQEATQGRARAELVKRQDILNTQKSLKALNAYSKADFVTAQNDVEVAKADLALTQTAVDSCEIKAPFGGRVANVPVRNFQFVQIGAPLLDLVSDKDLELEFIVPSVWLSWLKIGADARVQVTETQKSYDSKITRISGKVDAASQTIKIYGRIAGGDTSSLLPGMSGVAQFPEASH
ncbi:MAG: efflux RND transporter periplasmic adaptor subunit [Proteobacteria bacterium]|nr:efflux RND transporter periplasmic adaptor subunit [Pseudomonadota bacterium]